MATRQRPHDDRRAYADRHDEEDRPDERLWRRSRVAMAGSRADYAEKPQAMPTGLPAAEPAGDRYASRDEHDKHDEAEERHAPRRGEPKGSYYNYQCSPATRSTTSRTATA